MIIKIIRFDKKKISNFKDQDKKLLMQKKLIKKSQKLDWNINLQKSLIAKINGLNPYPGAWFNIKVQDLKLLKLLKLIKLEKNW